MEGIADPYRDHCRIKVIQSDATSAIETFLTDATVDWRWHRGVIFLDPFGMQVPWRTIESIAGKGGIEIILNLPVGMAIQRLLPRSGRFSDVERLKLTEYFGSPDWEEVIYDRTTDLFGQIDICKVQRSGERLAYWYRDRLKQAFGFSPPPRLVRNSQGGHLYYLLFAGPNETGAKIASDILKQGERIPRPR